MTDSMDDAFLDLLRCPVTQSRLEHADPSRLSELNAKISRGELTNRLGQAVTDPLEAGLVNADQSWLLPIRSGIVVLIADQAIELAGQAAGRQHGNPDEAGH